MLNANKKLTFSLPVVVDIDLREYDFVSDRIRKFLKFYFRKKSDLERFFEMDGHRVRKIDLILGQYNRLNVLLNTTITSLDELIIFGNKRWSKEDNEHLCVALNKMKPGLLFIAHCKWTLVDKETIAVTLQHVHTLILQTCGLENEHVVAILRTEHDMKVLKVYESAVRIDGEVIEAVSKSSSDINLDTSGKEITLIHKSATMKSLSISNCVIHKEIVGAVSRLPDHTQLDLSGNQVTDKSVSITISTQGC